MAHAREWRRAQSFTELCHLGARFVAGELRSFPGWGARELDPESDPLVPCLAACLRGGYLTVASQPGVAGARRAFVAGFASAGAVLALRSIAGDGIVVREEGPESSLEPALPVVLEGERVAVLAGGPARRAELAIFSRSIGRGARAELASLPFVWAVDLAWDASDALWSRLHAAFAPHIVGRAP